ncbi:MAG: hypothetical protein V3U80_04785 [Flavobacteriaceae bacterium]
MKTLKLTLVLLLATVLFTSCGEDTYGDEVSLNEILQSRDVWYIDSNQTTGSGDVRFMSLAFTVSFENGKIYANNNLVDLGSVGDGYGDQIGYYNTSGHELRIDHDLDGNIDFEVIQISNNRIKFRDHYENVTYTLKGYSVSNFDYDGIFYDNIEYFLQEYSAWEKNDTIGGVTNAFDDENYLAFIPENVNVFTSSQDVGGTTVPNLLWDFEGDYEVFDVQGIDNLKILTLNYDNNDNEEFELSVIDDGSISLYHHSSDTTYEFVGRDNIIYKKDGSVDKKDRKRFKVKRKTKIKKQSITKISNR